MCRPFKAMAKGTALASARTIRLPAASQETANALEALHEARRHGLPRRNRRGGRPGHAHEERRGAVIQEHSGILDAARLLGKKGVRRLPMVNTRSELVGIISLDDILVLLASEMGHIGAALSQELRRPKP
jgi:CBS-domain-containing membrane protein